MDMSMNPTLQSTFSGAVNYRISASHFYARHGALEIAVGP